MSTLPNPVGRRPVGPPTLLRDVVVSLVALLALVFGTLLLPSPPDGGDAGRASFSTSD